MIVNAKGQPTFPLMKGVKVIYGFVWSSDGKYLAFTREYPLTFPLDSPAYLGVYRMSDGARAIATKHSFKGTPQTNHYGWIYAPNSIR